MRAPLHYSLTLLEDQERPFVPDPANCVLSQSETLPLVTWAACFRSLKERMYVL